MTPKPLIVVCGPTCTGKTSLAITLAGEFGGEIISADSRQVYRYLNVGTGKIPGSFPKEAVKVVGSAYWFGAVPVHLYDLVPPNVNLTVVEYAKKASEEIASCWRRGKIPFLVGGTGFYLDVVLGRMQPAGVPPNPKLREELEKKSLAELNQLLKGLDPKRLEAIDQKNPRRLIRAIEIAQAVREGSVDTKSTSEVENVVGEPLVVGLTTLRGVLYQRADAWAQKIVGDGSLATEVRDLISRGYGESPALQGIIYAPTLEFVSGKISQAELLARIQFDLHGYIRRQQTWFKKNPQVVWFDVTTEGFDKQVAERVRSYLDGK